MIKKLEKESNIIIFDGSKHPIKGDLRIGIVPSLAPYLLYLFIRDFTDTYKKVKLIINEFTTEKRN